jgi:hypothetical protein
MKASCFQPAPDRKLTASDLFVVVSISSCNSCPKAVVGGTVGLKEEQDAIVGAFGVQLLKEDFTGFDLDDTDRDVQKWKISWDEISILSE